MKKHISVRLEESEIVLLNQTAKPYGGVAKWIKCMLNPTIGGRQALVNMDELRNAVDKVESYGKEDAKLDGKMEKSLARAAAKVVIDKPTVVARPIPRVLTDHSRNTQQPKHHENCQCTMCEMKRKEK